MDLITVKQNMTRKNLNLSPYACPDDQAFRLKKEEDDNDFRTPFYRDIDRVIYTLSYMRYMDKTQVFSFNENDNISKRMTHVQMVSKIGRTIGRALCLNEDLIEAAALGHDLGHVPFGHLGEKILNDLSLEYGEGYFNHNVQSVRILTNLENGGKGANITLQVLDAIMCHNGELELKEYRPKEKTKFDFIKEYKKTYIDKSAVTKLVPMTLEGCVVRVSDIIAYIGKDVEDAIRMHLIKKEEIPANVRKTLGTSNSEIINTIINDIVSNSLDKPYIKMSDNIFKALVELKKFNYEYIYSRANTEQDIQMYKKIFKTVFEYNLEQLSKENRKSHIYTLYLNDMSEIYLNKTNNIRKVIDYIAGMTDDFIVTEYNHIAK